MAIGGSGAKRRINDEHRPVASSPASRLAELRLALNRRVTSLNRSFEDIVTATAAGATDDEHDPEGHTIAWERQQIAALLATTNEKLDEIAEAEARLAAGEYGGCASCDRKISDARLEVLPTTVHCRNCAAATKDER